MFIEPGAPKNLEALEERNTWVHKKGGTLRSYGAKDLFQLARTINI